jgi:hypothetical protein
MRHEGVSLDVAARDAGTTPASVRKYLPDALQRDKSGHWVATESDPYVRDLTIPGPHGPVRVQAHGSEEARVASAYLNALKRWSKTERDEELAPFHGKKIGGFELVTSSRTLRALRDFGLLHLDMLYTALKDTA